MTTPTTSPEQPTDDATTVAQAVDRLLVEHDPRLTDDVAFRGARFDAGLAWVHFPVGHGGLGVARSLQALVESRLGVAGAAPQDPAGFFMDLAGPTVVTHGTDEQRARFLRPMFVGEQRWCQLFSEPGAGSDFAGLGCRAERDGDEWVVNGQKVWNTLAHLGDRAMLVTRTNPAAPKHRGLTYFALDMHAPGVEVRPLRQITGEAEFNEVYLTDVRIPDRDRIGDVDDGWRVALTTLMNERTAIGGGGASGSDAGPMDQALGIWRSLPAERRLGAHRDALLGLLARSEALRHTNERAFQASTQGNPGPEGSIGKLMAAELHQDITAFCLHLLGAAAMVGYDYTFRRPESLSASGTESGPRHAFLRTRANSIEGGTSEIMRNILGEQVLGLPGEPRVDKDVPWLEVPRS